MVGTVLSFRFADFEIDLARQELRLAGTNVHIEPQVFDLLVHLIRNRDRIVSKDELFDVIWQGRIVSEATLNSRISAARRALGDSGSDQSFIRTLHKRGFRFVGEIDEGDPAPATLVPIKTLAALAAAEATAPAVSPDQPSPLPPQPSTAAPDEDGFADRLAAAPSRPALADRASEEVAVHARLDDDRGPRLAPAEKTAPKAWRAARSPLFAAAVIGLASLPVSAVWWLMSSPSPEAESQSIMALASEALSSGARIRTQAPSIVVLPFLNLSGDPKRDYVADGITDSLISDLARALPGISVVSRGTAFTYKGQGVDPRQVGRELGVRYLLNGSIVFDGESVRVNTHLAETRDGSQLWAERFDTERKGILQVQDEIVARVSRAIGLKVIDIEARRSRRERPESAEFVDLVMRGKAVLNLPSSPATMIEARDLFEQALKVDPARPDGPADAAATPVLGVPDGSYA